MLARQAQASAEGLRDDVRLVLPDAYGSERDVVLRVGVQGGGHGEPAGSISLTSGIRELPPTSRMVRSPRLTPADQRPAHRGHRLARRAGRIIARTRPG